MPRRLRRLALIALLVCLLTGGPAAAASRGPTNEARYLTMRDGVRIAIDVWLPPARSAPIPALIRATRYWRALGVTDRFPADSNLEEATAVTDAGYARVLVDVRGTGASFGTWSSPWAPAEVADLGEVVDWIVAQSWSNGRVGAYGVSYEGNTAEFVGTVGREAVKAVVPRFDDFEILSPASPSPAGSAQTGS